MTTSIVELDAVHKRYGRVTALDGLDLRVYAGEVLGLLGHNGAGKTTAMKLILGVSSADAGRVQVFGHSPHGRGARALRGKLGYLPENVSFYRQLSGREVLEFFGRLKRVRPAQIDELLARVGLLDAAERRVKTYSKGMRQRLGLAQALLGEPELLLLDEPSVGLDPVATRDFYAMLDELRGRGVAVVLCSHVLAGMERHIDRAAILGAGRLLASGSLAELRQQAEVPLTIRVRGEFADEKLQRLRALGAETCRVNGHHIELRTATGGKIAALRELLADPAVQDIEMEPPSLETLYVYFGNRRKPGEDKPCTC